MGNQARGNRTQIQIASESVYGTPPSPFNGRLVRWTFPETMSQESRPEVSDEVTNDRMRMQSVDMNFRPSGDINGRLHVSGAISTLLKHLMGTVNTSGSGPFMHVMIPAATLPVGFTMEKGLLDLGIYYRFLGCRINSMNFTLTQEGAQRCSVNILAKEVDEPAETSLDEAPEGSTAEDFEGGRGACFIGTAGQSGSLIASARSANITISNDLDPEGFAVSGSKATARKRVDAHEGWADCTGSLVMRFESNTEYNKFLAGTPVSFTWKMTDSNGYYIEIYLPRIKYGGRPTPQADQNKGLVHTVEFQAEKDNTLGYSHRITVYNNESSIS